MEIEIKRDYWPNENVRYESLYLNELEHGFQKIYYPNGQINGEWNMVNGIETGMDRWWNKDKTRKSMSQYKKNENHGFEINFNYKKIK